MKLRNLYPLLFTSLILSTTSRAQQVALVRELKVNDTIPDLLISKLQNRDQRSVKLSDLYKKGGMIIDFWASWCSPCVAALPKLDSLVIKNPGLSVLSVSHDDSTLTARFLKTWKGNTSHLVLTNDDKMLSSLFKHRSLPHMAWIDRSGVVKLITGDYFVNEKNVKDFLAQKEQKVAIKKDVLNFDWVKPLHVEDNAFQYRSIFTNFNDSISGRTRLAGAASSGLTSRFMKVNSSITNLYWIAFSDQLTVRINWDRVILRTKDSSRFFWPETQKALFRRSKYFTTEDAFQEQRRQWMKDNLFCYELMLPYFAKNEEFSQMMMNDLNRISGIKGWIENKRITTKVLQRIKGDLASRSIKTHRGPVDYAQVFEQTNDRLIVKGRTLAQTIAYLSRWDNSTVEYLPLINETGFNDPLDMILEVPPGKKISADIMEEMFRKIGLEFVDKKRKVPVLVLEDGRKINYNGVIK